MVAADVLMPWCILCVLLYVWNIYSTPVADTRTCTNGNKTPVVYPQKNFSALCSLYECIFAHYKLVQW